MSPLPVTIRLLDPPLHEFLPRVEELNEELKFAEIHNDHQRAEELRSVLMRVHALAEANPMMGHRGCRLSVTYPEILEMQITAILQAAIEVESEGFAPARKS